MVASAVEFDNLFAGFESSYRNYPLRPALQVDQHIYSYSDLYRLATNLVRVICLNDKANKPLAAFLAYRSITAYSAVLGILGSGKGYVPLHPGFPVERSRMMLNLSGADILVVGKEAISVLAGLLEGRQEPLTVICPDTDDLGTCPSRFPQHRFISRRDCADCPMSGNHTDKPVSPIAYLLFTSGSTGVPKGVPVSQNNVVQYLRYSSERYAIRPEDRFSQMFSMTFDLSVHDMFLCWTSGACLFSVPHASLMAPSRFIRDNQLTVWFSVPSVIMFMQKMRSLKPASFPSLRLSLFCGEPLLETMAEAWHNAAPSSVLENLYGPTEATIAISHYRWEPGAIHPNSNGIVPIGTVFPTQNQCVIDGNRNVVPKGQPGELCVAGSQITEGYLNNPVKTREQFIQLPGKDCVWYRTGDLVMEYPDGCLQYLGRIDDQVQVCGHRVELQEVDHALRQACQTDQAVSVAWPPASGRADAIYAFICAAPDFSTETVIAYCKGVMPDYMIPRMIFVIDQMPLNVNGKIDRASLAQRVGELINAE